VKICSCLINYVMFSFIYFKMWWMYVFQTSFAEVIQDYLTEIKYDINLPIQ
jgi:hypothetical protein